jgi:hypothetical protein
VSSWFARARVVVLALPTHLVAVSTAIVWLAPQIAQVFPERAETISAVALRVVAGLAAAIGIIRRVTPVDDASQVGILPQGPPASPVVLIAQTPPVDTPEKGV